MCPPHCPASGGGGVPRLAPLFFQASSAVLSPFSGLCPLTSAVSRSDPPASPLQGPRGSPGPGRSCGLSHQRCREKTGARGVKHGTLAKVRTQESEQSSPSPTPASGMGTAPGSSGPGRLRSLWPCPGGSRSGVEAELRGFGVGVAGVWSPRSHGHRRAGPAGGLPLSPFSWDWCVGELSG